MVHLIILIIGGIKLDRNNELEKKLMSLLEKAYENTDNQWDSAMIVNAALALYKSTNEKAYAEQAKHMLDSRVTVIEQLAQEHGLDKFMWGNALYNIGDYSGEEKYSDMAVKLASYFNQQERSKQGYFTTNGDNTECCNFYYTQPFYMNYDTRDGKKEHYNDIIAQYNAFHIEYIEKLSQNIQESQVVQQYEKLVYYAASFIDTMEVMAQPLYEIYRKLQDYYKETVHILLQPNILENVVQKEKVMLAYVILKGCRMKALLTEKYEHIALNILAAALQTIEENDKTLASGELAAITFGYSEAIRNRAYQDYGRGKGGVLWS